MIFLNTIEFFWVITCYNLVIQIENCLFRLTKDVHVLLEVVYTDQE